MIRHQGPGLAPGLRLNQQSHMPADKHLASQVVKENVAFFDPSDHHMLEESRDVESCSPWHEGKSCRRGTLVK